MPAASPSFKAGGDIAPSRFVKGGSADHTVVQGTANATTIGISMEGTQEPPIPGYTTPLAASDGEQLKVYGEGEECLVEAGGTIAAFGEVKSDANGKAVAIATTGTTVQNIAAIALEGGASGELIRVQIRTAKFRPALS